MPAKTELPPKGDARAIYVLDISGYVFRAYHALPPLSNQKGEATHAVHGVTNMLLKLVRERQPERLIVAMESPTPTLRRTEFPEYKANRPPAPPDLKQQMIRIRQIVEAYGIPVCEAPGYEADDVIATLVQRAKKAGFRPVIVSADKDLLQLVDEHVVMYDTMKDRVLGVAETTEKMGVPPHQIRDLLALMGDSSDNVPGVKSVGPKTAVQLLTDYGTIEGIYENIEAIAKKALKKNLLEGREAAKLSQRLVTLHDDLEIAIDFEALHWTGGDPEALRPLFVELELTRLLATLGPPSQKSVQRENMARDAIGARPGEYETLLTRDALDRYVRGTTSLAIATVLEPNDPLRGDIIGIALSCRATSGAYVPIAHRYIGAPESLPLATVLEKLRPVLETAELRAEDLKRELVLYARLGITPRKLGFDTMLASYLLDANRREHTVAAMAQTEYGVSLADPSVHLRGRNGWDEIDVPTVERIMGQHVDFVQRLADRLGPQFQQRETLKRLMFDVELPLARVLADMELAGVELDSMLLKRLSTEVEGELVRLERKCWELAGHEFNVDSPRQLESILFDELQLPVIKKTKTARSTDADVLEELSVHHALPNAILERRTLSKLKSTYLDALPQRVIPGTGRVHTRYNQTVAATGRLSSSDPNLQNIPIRTEQGRRVRDAFIAPKGTQILAADYSQIELRVLAHLSRDEELCEAFSENADVHVRTATALFGVEAPQVTRHMREQAKTVNFAVIYGQTQFALSRNLGIERREAKRYIDAFFARYEGVRRFMEKTIEDAHRTGQVETILGRVRRLPDLASKNHNLRAAAERVARNTPIQGSAADIMKLAMVNIQAAIRERGLKSRMVLTVHDELVFEVPNAEKEVMEQMVKHEMENAFSLSVPLVVGMGWGKHWGEAH